MRLENGAAAAAAKDGLRDISKSGTVRVHRGELTGSARQALGRTMVTMRSLILFRLFGGRF